MTSDTPLPLAVVAWIETLIQRSDVQSVSFPFQDEAVWRMLVTEQLERTRRTGLHLQHAFGLSGPDSGLPFDTAAWGGYVHIPYEGMCDGDLIVKPDWREFDLQRAAGRLSRGIVKECRHLLLKGVHRDIDSAVRITADGWTLYSAAGPYVPCNPFLNVRYDPKEPLPSPWAEPL